MVEKMLTPRAWRAYRLTDFPHESWEADGDVLHARPMEGGAQLATRERFGDFDLSLEWRLPVGGNSGLLYRVSEALEQPWQSGPEMQLLDNANHPDGQVPETRCGALYGVFAPSGAPVCPPGLYNFARVRVLGARVEHWLNGIRVLECELEGRTFSARLLRSKFRDQPRFAREREGHIVLQHHGDAAWFRNIRIARL